MGADDMVWPVARPVEEVSVVAWWTSERAAPKDRPPLFCGTRTVAVDTRDLFDVRKVGSSTRPMLDAPSIGEDQESRAEISCGLEPPVGVGLWIQRDVFRSGESFVGAFTLSGRRRGRNSSEC
jgi:hypothetical protein